MKLLAYWDEFSAEHGEKLELFGDVVGGYASWLVDPEDDDDDPEVSDPEEPDL